MNQNIKTLRGPVKGAESTEIHQRHPLHTVSFEHLR